MRRFVLMGLVCVCAAAAYVAVPFYTAWSIREAIRAGNSTYLADKIEWASLKETLKPSIARMALDLPPEEGEDWAGVKPTMWQRIKAYMGQGMVNRVVEKYVTPEGLPQLFNYRKMYRDKAATAPTDENSQPLTERLRNFWARVKRAEFVTVSRFEIDVADRNAPDRVMAGVLELRGLEWKLTELRVRQQKSSPDTFAATQPDGSSPQER